MVFGWFATFLMGLVVAALLITSIGGWSMIPKSGIRFSDQIMLKQKS
jgi:hypothetical protein